MARPTILVTGADGQLGRELQEASTAYPDLQFVFLSRSELSIDNEGKVRQAFLRYQPAWCINCAAYTFVDKAESESDLAFKINATAAENLAGICHQHDCQLIHISTDYVFDGTTTGAYTEDMPVNPQSVYGRSKLAGEQAIISSDPSAIIIRTSWLYSSFGKNFLKTILRLLNEKESISVVNDQFGTPTYAADLANAIIQIIVQVHDRGQRIHGIFHYANTGIVTWYDFASAIRDMAQPGKKVVPISTAEYPTAAKRPARSALDTTKISETFGVSCPPWKESLQRCIAKLQGK